jgi:hypothetical protein
VTDPQPARVQLLAFAAAVRGHEWAKRLDGALTAAAMNGWTWQRAGLEACRLIFTEGTDPRDLLAAAKNPLIRSRPAPPSPEYAAARAALSRLREGPAA